MSASQTARYALACARAAASALASSDDVARAEWAEVVRWINRAGPEPVTVELPAVDLAAYCSAQLALAAACQYSGPIEQAQRAVDSALLRRRLAPREARS